MKMLLFCIISLLIACGPPREREVVKIRADGGSCVYNYNSYNYMCNHKGQKLICDNYYSCVVVDTFSVENSK